MQKPNPRGCCGNPGTCLKCAQGQKSLKGLQRATLCTDRAQTSRNVSRTVELFPPHQRFGQRCEHEEMCPKEKIKSHLYIHKCGLNFMKTLPHPPFIYIYLYFFPLPLAQTLHLTSKPARVISTSTHLISPHYPSRAIHAAAGIHPRPPPNAPSFPTTRTIA